MAMALEMMKMSLKPVMRLMGLYQMVPIAMMMMFDLSCRKVCDAIDNDCNDATMMVRCGIVC